MANEVLVLEGVKETRKALKDASPTILKETDKRIRDIFNAEVKIARAFVPKQPPLSGWSTWDGVQAQRAIKRGKSRNRKVTNGWISSQGLMNSSKFGAIFEMAGRKSSGNTPQGSAFVTQLTGRYQQAGRAIWRALDEGGRQRIQRGLIDAYDDALKKIESDLNSQVG